MAPHSMQVPSLASPKHVNHQASKTFRTLMLCRRKFAACLGASQNMESASFPVFYVQPQAYTSAEWAVSVVRSVQQSKSASSAVQAYQVLKNGGLEDDHIVVMMSDDLANNIMNPHPGKLFNRPYGPDVYEGVPLVCFAPLASYTAPPLTWCTSAVSLSRAAC